MNNKAFTLVELLVTITLITLVSGLIIPNMIGIVNDVKEDTYKAQIKEIEKASLDWINLHTGAAPKDGNQIIITLGDLKKEGLIDIKLINAKTKKKFPDDLLIYISKENKYIINIDEESGTNQDITLNKSTMVMKGSYSTYQEINEPYVDAGVIVYDENGDVVPSSSIITTIKENNITKSIINTSKLTKYEITYKATIKGEDISKTRHVTINDTESPKITVPTNTLISTLETTYNVLDGVTVNDNSLESITVNTTGNLTLTVPGSYIITYTAKDSSGNKTTKKRQIIISDEFINE